MPTMTGGVGQQALARFYRDHFVNSNPHDTRLTPVSRTIGTDRVVDEVLFCFTHDVEIPWMLPGVQPTGKYVEVLAFPGRGHGVSDPPARRLLMQRVTQFFLDNL